MKHWIGNEMRGKRWGRVGGESMGQKQDQSPGAEGRDEPAGRADGADDRQGGRPAARRRMAVRRPARRAACALRPCKDGRRGGRPAPCGLARATGRIAGDERNRRGAAERWRTGGRGRSLLRGCETGRLDSRVTHPQPTPNPHLVKAQPTPTQ